MTALSPELRYSGSLGSAQWCGFEVSDEDRFKSYMAGRVSARVKDDDAHDPFAAELRGMATTGMATEFVEDLLRAVPEEKSWAIERPWQSASCRRRDARDLLALESRT